jgi:hypothetical protein
VALLKKRYLSKGADHMKARLGGVTLIATLLLIPAAASAHEFTATETAAVTYSGGRQSFGINGGQWGCEKVTGTGSATAGSQQTLVVDLTFTECEVFGDAAKISTPAVLLLMAGPYFDLANNMVVTIPVAKCSILFAGGGTVNKSLKTVEFKNSGKGIVVTDNVSGISYEPSGGICGTGKTVQHNGTSTGIGVLTPEKGTLSWK